ncbi:MAG: hypothetical protein ABI670_12500 [Chloroflexota bacterium]
MEDNAAIPLGTFVEFTWHSLRQDDLWDDYPDPTDSAQLVGVVGHDTDDGPVRWSAASQSSAGADSD